LIKLLPIVVFALLLSLCAPLSVYASIGSDEFCAQNAGHFACDNENDNDSDDDGKSDEDENPDNAKFDEPSGCYAAGYEDGQTGPFDSEVYHDNCEGEGRYYDGFIDGCVDAGNTRDACESATDA
jgi:hypothetical protein